MFLVFVFNITWIAVRREIWQSLRANNPREQRLCTKVVLDTAKIERGNNLKTTKPAGTSSHYLHFYCSLQHCGHQTTLNLWLPWDSDQVTKDVPRKASSGLCQLWATEVEGVPSISPHSRHHRKHLICVSISQHATDCEYARDHPGQKKLVLFLQYIILQSTSNGWCTLPVFRAFCFPACLVSNSAEGQEEGRNKNGVCRHIRSGRGKYISFPLVDYCLFIQKPLCGWGLWNKRSTSHVHTVVSRPHLLSKSYRRCQPSWSVLCRKPLNTETLL